MRYGYGGSHRSQTAEDSDCFRCQVTSLGPRGGVEIGVIFGEVGKKTPPAKLARDVSPSVDCPGPGTRANE